MARLDELAEGITQLLALSPSPEPLPVDLKNHTPVDATVFVRAVIDACERCSSPIALVRICPRLGARLLREHSEPREGYRDIPIEADDRLSGRIEFYRFTPSEGPQSDSRS